MRMEQLPSPAAEINVARAHRRGGALASPTPMMRHERLVPPKIFISYHRSDALVARRLHRSLLLIGFRVWLDTEEVQHCDRWAQAIDVALRTSDRMVLLLSEAACGSQEVFNEWFFFYCQHKPIHVIRLDECVPHYQLMPLQRLEWTDQCSSDWDARVAILAKKLRSS